MNAISDDITSAGDDGAPKSKRFRHISIRRNPASTTESEIMPLEEELNRYFNEFPVVSEDVDPIDYWNTQNGYPSIADLAIDYAVTPASSSSAESMFSHAGFLSSGLRSRMSPENLEAQVMVKTNYIALK